MTIKREYDEDSDTEKFVFSVDFLLEPSDVEAILAIKNEATDADIRRLKRVTRLLFSRIDSRFHEGKQWYQILGQCWRLQDDLASPLKQLAEAAE